MIKRAKQLAKRMYTFALSPRHDLKRAHMFDEQKYSDKTLRNKEIWEDDFRLIKKFNHKIGK